MRLAQVSLRPDPLPFDVQPACKLRWHVLATHPPGSSRPHKPQTHQPALSCHTMGMRGPSAVTCGMQAGSGPRWDALCAVAGASLNSLYAAGQQPAGGNLNLPWLGAPGAAACFGLGDARQRGSPQP